MKIVVIGGTGLIGTKVVALLRAMGHEAIAASPNTGVNTITGEGLAEVMQGAEVVVDVANSPSFEDAAVLEFFTTSGRKLREAEAVAGVKHHVALSVVGTERLLESGYFRGKMEQEKIIKAGPTPYTIVRATQFFEFMGSIAQSASEGGAVRISTASMQPVSSDDVAAAVADAAVKLPANEVVEVAGPERLPMSEFVQRYLRATNDSRPVLPDRDALYYGARLSDDSLTPGRNPGIGKRSFDAWLSSQRQSS